MFSAALYVNAMDLFQSYAATDGKCAGQKWVKFLFEDYPECDSDFFLCYFNVIHADLLQWQISKDS